jgi:hypothetical protein
MGGPAAGILLKQVPESDQLAILKTWLGEIADFRANSPTDIREGWGFFARWPVECGEEPPRGACLGGIQLSVLDLAGEYTGASCLTPNDWAGYEKAIGWMPAAELTVSIFCNQPRDHKTLAWLCIQIAERFDGVVDLDGIIPIPDREERMLAGLSGSVVEVSYEIEKNRRGRVHVVDSEFLRGWIRHPSFHMIK